MNICMYKYFYLFAKRTTFIKLHPFVEGEKLWLYQGSNPGPFDDRTNTTTELPSHLFISPTTFHLKTKLVTYITLTCCQQTIRESFKGFHHIIICTTKLQHVCHNWLVYWYICVTGAEDGTTGSFIHVGYFKHNLSERSQFGSCIPGLK